MTDRADTPERLPFDDDADRLVGSFVGMLGTADEAHFDVALRSLLVAFNRYFDLTGVRLTLGPNVVEVGRIDGHVDRTVHVAAPDQSVLSMDLNGSDDRPVTPAAEAIARAVLSFAAALHDRRRADARLRHVATHDDLTGLLNRAAFGERLIAALGAEPDRPAVLVRCDVDRLSAVNATFGNAAGDVVVRAVAARLDHAAGPGALVARVGGDEFAALLPDRVPGPTLDAFLADLREQLQRPVSVVPRGGSPDGALGHSARRDVETAEVVRTVTIGCAVSAGAGTPVAELVRCATQAAMAGKRRGGAVTVVYDESMRRADEIRSEVEIRLPRAIRDDELVLHYQPEVDLRTTEVLGAEALVRWNHPTLGLLAPDSFIDTVESSPYALRFGRWVLEHACAQWSTWMREFGWDDTEPPRVRVNITPTQLMKVDFVETIEAILQRYALPPAALGLEITERDVVRDHVAAEQTLQGLARLGVTVALDDFGTGYSSFGQLRQFTVSAVKIDRSFVGQLATDTNDRSIVQAVVSLARSLGLDVVAEGVQDHAAAELLIGMGCRRGQGFLYGRPVPPDDLASVLRAGRTDTH